MKCKYLIPVLFMMAVALEGCNHSGNAVSKELGNMHWELIESPVSEALRGLCVVNDQVVWVSGNHGVYAKTTDGGKSWVTDTINGYSFADFRDIEAIDENVAYVMASGLPAVILKTTDGGKSWKELYRTIQSGVFFNSIEFWNEKEGIVLSDPIDEDFLILITNDGGDTWEHVGGDKLPDALPLEINYAASGTCIALAGDSYAWFVTGGGKYARVFRTKNKGITWDAVNTPLVAGEQFAGGYSIAFKDTLNGIIVGGIYTDQRVTGKNIAVTKDGGGTWKLINEKDGYRSCVAYVQPDKSDYLVKVGPSGSEFSINGGESWCFLDSIDFHSVDFSGIHAGWASGAGGKIGKLVSKK